MESPFGYTSPEQDTSAKQPIAIEVFGSVHLKSERQLERYNLANDYIQVLHEAFGEDFDTQDGS